MSNENNEVLMRNAEKLNHTINDARKWRQTERALNEHKAQDSFQNAWEKSASADARVVLEGSKTYGEVYARTLGILERANADHQSPLYEKGEMVFGYYVRRLNQDLREAGWGEVSDHVFGHLRRFGEEKEVLHRF